MATSDKQFDAQFDKVANLTHYPWIGSGYASAPNRVLIMGHSHYAKDGKEFSQEEYDRNISDKEYTREIIMNPAKRNVLDLKNETCKNREKRNVLKISHTRHFKTTKKQSRTGCFYSFER